MLRISLNKCIEWQLIEEYFQSIEQNCFPGVHLSQKLLFIYSRGGQTQLWDAFDALEYYLVPT